TLTISPRLAGPRRRGRAAEGDQPGGAADTVDRRRTGQGSCLMADPLIWTTTSVRIEWSLLRDLNVAAAKANTTVNRLILDGIHHVLTLHNRRMAGMMARTAR